MSEWPKVQPPDPEIAGRRPRGWTEGHSLISSQYIYYIPVLCHDFISCSCMEMGEDLKKNIYINFLMITKIILLKWFPSAVMPKLVGKVGYM